MSSALDLLKHVFAMLALAGYIANGAQAHVSGSPGETLTVQMCGGSSRTITLSLGGEPIVPSDNTKCGACMVLGAAPTPAPLALPVILPNAQPQTSRIIHIAHPGSPLWPGAPPHGPPLTHKA